MLEYCKKEAIGLLVPLFDIDVPVLAANRALFAAVGTLVVTAEPEAVDICNDKWKTFTVLKEAGIPVPASWLAMEEALKAAGNGSLSWPVMVKPRWGMGSLSVYQADNPEEMKVLAGKCRRGIQDSYMKYESMADPDSCVLFQQRIKGREYGLDVMNGLDGRYRTTIVKEKMAMRSGETDAAGTIDNKELEGLGRTLGTLLCHRGNRCVDGRRLLQRVSEFGCGCAGGGRNLLCSGNERPLWGRISLQPCCRRRPAPGPGTLGHGKGAAGGSAVRQARRQGAEGYTASGMVTGMMQS